MWKRIFRSEGHLVLLLTLMSAFHETTVQAADVESRNDSLALSTIFDDDNLQQNLHSVRAVAQNLPLQKRFEFLSNWVLPGTDHSTFRLAMDFTPTGAVGGSSVRRFTGGGELVAPALDLVTVAAELGVLPQLRERIDELQSNDMSSSRNQQVMLVLCDIAAGNVEAVENGFAKLHAELRTLIRPRCPETLAIFAGVQSPKTREVAQELLSYLLDSFIRGERVGSHDAWDHQMSALGGRNRLFHNSPDDRVLETKNWIPVSRMTARSRGSGFPCGGWDLERGKVSNIASHDEDCLYYRSPLRGDFEVECDVTLNGWQHSHLSVGGLWVAPVWGLSTFERGLFRQRTGLGKIEPPLAATNEWIRYRTVVRNSRATTFFDGRKIHEEPLDHDCEPWVSIRSPWYADGAVRDLRITGKPYIPEELNISAARGLPGWFSYQNRTLGTEWIQTSSGIIVGAERTDLRGAFSESLLQYNRPMLEDGVIEYEFLYKAGRNEVHPADLPPLTATNF